MPKELINQQAVETSFYDSLAQLILNVGVDISPDLYTNLPYPYNILRVLKSLHEKLFSISSLYGVDFTQIGESEEVAIVTYQYYHLNGTLYLPLKELYERVTFLPDNPETLLLLSIYAYLYQVADIRSFHQESSDLNIDYSITLEFFANEAECNNDNNNSDEEYPNYAELRDSLVEQLSFAEEIELHMLDKKHLEEFAQRLESFAPQNIEDETLRSIAEGFFQLYQQYPNRSFYDKFEDLDELIDTDSEYGIGHHRSVGMIWDYDDVFPHVEENIRCDIDNCAVVSEPLDIKVHIPGLPYQPHDLSFESKFFSLFGKLIDYVIEQ